MSSNVLSRIAENVSKRLEERKKTAPLADLEAKVRRARVPHDFDGAFRTPGIHTIAEIKFRSPALGVLETSGTELALQIAGQYLSGGATAISVLTETDHFHGNPEYLRAVRDAYPRALLLMKDFVLEEYQILEGLLWGADAILLIVALLGKARTQELLKFARNLGLSVLVEVHDEEELQQAIEIDASLIGVNNRNLKTLEVSLENSKRMAAQIVPDKIFISESGISASEDLKSLLEVGYRGFLVGSTLMTSAHPGEKLRTLIAGAK